MPILYRHPAVRKGLQWRRGHGQCGIDRNPSTRPTVTDEQEETPQFREVIARTRAEWRAWLEAHHTQRETIWLAFPKKASGTDLSYDAVVEEALCFGWIDSVTRKRDDELTMLRLSPRRAGSGWSRANKERVERLIAMGRMRPAGRAVIERAQEDGSWSALDAVESLEIPEDLERAFQLNKAARRHYESFPPGSQKLILMWIATAKRPETREARIAEVVRLAAEGRRANHPQPVPK